MAKGGARAFGVMDRMLAGELGRLFSATLGGVVLLYLVIDFADRASGYRGRAWGKAVAELYVNRAAVVVHQLAPAALLLASALLIARLSRRGELVALFGLGVRPLRLAMPIAAFALALGALLAVFYERVVVRADARADVISVQRFHTWGDWGNYQIGSSWVRGRGGRIFHLGPRAGTGFEPATVLELGIPFRLARRIDARRLEPAGPGTWRLLDAVETRYPEPEMEGDLPIEQRREAALLEPFPDTLEELALRSGRPRQMSLRTLREQAKRRERLGLPAREYRVALAERLVAPLEPAPTALAAVGLTLRRGRGGRRRARTVAAAFALGIGFTMSLWAVSVVVHAISVAGALPPLVAAPIPAALAATVALVTLWRAP